jgi:hypothetical protein
VDLAQPFLFFKLIKVLLQPSPDFMELPWESHRLSPAPLMRVWLIDLEGLKVSGWV